MTSEDEIGSSKLTRRDILQLCVGGLGAASLASAIGNTADLDPQTTVTGNQSTFRPQIPLSGSWKFQLDPLDIGEQERWFAHPEKIRELIHVPGCWQAQGFGKPSGTLRHHYVGTAWYLREVVIPQEWRAKRIDLVIGGAFTYTTAYVNGREVASHAGFSTPFRLDITTFVKAGDLNIISLRVANARHYEEPVDMGRNDYREPTGCLNYIARWGGLYGDVNLEAYDATSIQDVAIRTDIVAGLVQFIVGVRNESSSALNARLLVSVGQEGKRAVLRNVKQVSVRGNIRTDVSIEVEIPDAQLWSPDEPTLYRARIQLVDGVRPVDEVEETFGMREVRAEGTKLLLNGKPLYLRGYGDDSVYVISGTPPISKEIFIQRLKLARSLGFNVVRFHSWTPTPEFFDAADEVGMLVMAELPVESALYFLPNREFVRKEMIRIIQACQNHPSWLSLALGNEFNLRLLRDKQTETIFMNAVRDFVVLAKKTDPTRLVLSNDGYLVEPTDIVSLYNGFSAELPTVKHEYGAYFCSLPDVSLIDRFTGVFRPQWLQEKKDWLRSRGLLDSYPIYLGNSWRLLQTARKANIENIRRLNEIIGYQYWLMTDFPEGTPEGAAWEWGCCNYFWEPKGIIPTDMEELNSAVLPMISLGVNDRTMWAEQGKKAEIFISNFGPEAIVDGELEWELRRDRNRLAGGKFRMNAPLGEVTKVGNLIIEKVPVSDPCELELMATASYNSRHYKNVWNLWAFPKQCLMQNPRLPIFTTMKWDGLFRFFPFINRLQGTQKGVPQSLLISSDLNDDVVRSLCSGGRVLLLADPDRFDQQYRSDYFPISGGAIGICLPAHPAFGNFPHDGFPDLQFYNLLNQSSEFDLEGLEGAISNLDVIAGGIRTTREGRTNKIARFALLFQANVGKGKILICTMNIKGHLDEQYPEAMFLLDRLLQYATSASFRPSATMSPKQFSDLVVPYVRLIHAF